MELNGIVRDGIIVINNGATLPEGTRVRIVIESQEQSKPFGERFKKFRGAARGLPRDLAEQHDHYRLGTAKR